MGLENTCCLWKEERHPGSSCGGQQFFPGDFGCLTDSKYILKQVSKHFNTEKESVPEGNSMGDVRILSWCHPSGE